jgi:enhancer of polycomb-like protein
MDQEIPDYDMDSEDETWFNKQSKNFKNLSLSPLKFENMMDRLEKGSGQTVRVTFTDKQTGFRANSLPLI